MWLLDVVVFTGSQKGYAEIFLYTIDPQKFVKSTYFPLPLVAVLRNVFDWAPCYTEHYSNTWSNVEFDLECV